MLETNKQEGHWEHYSHDADIGIRGSGPTIESAFEMAALALTATVTDLEKVLALENCFITCRNENDLDLLFFDFLNEVIFQMDVNQMLFSKSEIQFRHNILTATLSGEKINLEKHHPAVYIKGATFTDLKVGLQDGRWIAQCVIDV